MKETRMRIVMMGLLLVVAACRGVVGAPDQELEFEELASGAHARTPAAFNEYIVEPRRFAEVWAHAGGARPAVDFTRHAVVAAFIGQRNTGGHSVEVVRVVRRGDSLEVHLRLREPGEGCMTTQALTRPFQLVRVPAGAAKAEFVVERVAVVCR
jgi:hypothetical protein